MTFQCSICWKKYNDFDKNILKIICPYCNNITCSKCAEHCLLDQKVAYHCSNCKKEWNFSFIFNSFSQEFIKNKLIYNYSNICKIIDNQQYISVYTKNKKILDIIVIFFNNLFDLKNIDNLNRHQIKYIINKRTNYSHCISFYNITMNDNIYYYSYYVYILYNIFNNNINYLNEHNYKCYCNTLISLLNKDKLKYIQLDDKILDIINIDIIEQYKNIPKTNILYDINLIISKHIKLNIDNEHIFGNCFKNECQGFLNMYQTQLRCNICNSCFCIKCHKEIFPLYYEYYTYYNNIEYVKKIINPNINVLLDEQLKHTCNEDDIKNIQFLTLGTKHCPNCNELIYKDGGCNHMWCSKCKTMFNWNDLKIINSTTNPHFYNWLKQLGITTTEYYNNPEKYITLSLKNKENKKEKILYLLTEAQQILETYFELIVPIIDKLIDFSNLLCIPKKISNEQILTYIRLLYAYNLITEEDYTLSISRLYIEKYFIEDYNKIIDNTIYMVSILFKNIPEFIHLPKFNDVIINNMNEIIKIHNNAVYKYNIIYPYFSVDLINEYNFNIKRYNSLDTFNINKLLDVKIPIIVKLNCYNYGEIEYITDDTNKKYIYSDQILYKGIQEDELYDTLYNKEMNDENNFEDENNFDDENNFKDENNFE